MGKETQLTEDDGGGCIGWIVIGAMGVVIVLVVMLTMYGGVA